MDSNYKQRMIERVLNNQDKFSAWSDEQREQSLTQAIAHFDELKDVWVFGYGSLIWRPEFDFEESHIATLQGYRRDLCLWSTVNRGTPDNPGLVFGLIEGGECQGKVFRLSNHNLLMQLRKLWQRELPNSSYIVKWLPCETAKGTVQALAFVMDPHPDNYAFIPNLSEEDTIDIVLSTSGSRGPCSEYVLETSDALEAANIKDDKLKQLADKIKARLQPS
ncbi:gamma-glutamylcyclotransferase [Brackiella oedipodis]|uniref:gamma-glutamylcyclotransferase n=1 Tax=Brackiella oedipodis TaxID=124225 RepID=UPI00048FBC95|nr:gamma-glutamylcyclotransferase [Brackiella oedipodis]